MRKIKQDIFHVGAIDWDRRVFDELIPLPEGTSYNAYLVKDGSQTVLFDTVDPTKTMTLVENLVKAGVDKIDYVIAHHAEQDHSGSIPDILTLYPDAKVVTNPKCKAMLMDLLSISNDKFITVNDGQELTLGGKTLRFIYTPWVHWPETFVTYLVQDRILFSCDFFGSHLATSNLFATERTLWGPAKRYYAEIMMPFRVQIRNNLEKIDALELDMIAPSHGPVYDKPRLIVDAYKDWTSDKVENQVVLPYVSMHASTAKMVGFLVDALIERGITVKQFNLAKTDIGELAMSLVDAATVVIGSPTVLTGAHPLAVYACTLINALRPKTKFVSIIGSFGWGSKMSEQITSLLQNLEAEPLPGVIIKGYPKDEDIVALEQLADRILTKHTECKII